MKTIDSTNFDLQKARKAWKKSTSSHLREGKENRWLGPILFKLYGIFRREWIRKLIRKIVLTTEGGEFYSITIRKIFLHFYHREIGLYSGGGAFGLRNFTNTLPGVRIGRYCSIINTIAAFNANHPLEMKSSHAFFYNPRLGYIKKDVLDRTRLEIGNDVWIGHNAIILPSVEFIGDGAVIAAGAVVRDNVPAYAIVVGVPARIVRYRFTPEKIQELQTNPWWDKPFGEILNEFSSYTVPLEPKEDGQKETTEKQQDDV